ncbi:MAG: hypothetical protein HC875_17110 [Anaerolineales bacterium]|nr:hypothetical protein [Anaerolineales bacterium]
MLWKVIKKLLPGLALLLVIISQLNYLPARLDYLRQLVVFAHAEPTEAARLAYYPASYDLLVWVEQHTAPDTSLLLLTASPRTYGDPTYVLYHRALYHLYPRPVWWAAPVSANRYPAWWLPTDLTEANILTLAEAHGAKAILADGFAQPPVAGAVLSFDADTYLIFLDGSSQILSSEDRGQGSGVGVGGRRSPPLPRRDSLHLAVGRRAVSSHAPSFSWFVAASTGRRLAAGLWDHLTGRLLAALGRPVTDQICHWIKYPGLSALALPPPKNPSSLLPPLRHLVTLSPCHPVTPSPHPLPPNRPRRLRCLGRPLTDWDAWVNWAGKANAIYMDQTLSPNLYHHPARLPTNMDYPLFLPLVEAWFYTWLGRLHEPAINLISLLFYAALLLLFYHAARRLASPTAALGFTVLLATLPRLERPAATGLADIPLAALVLLSFLLLFEWHNNFTLQPSNPPTFQPSNPPTFLALATALLPWLKNEGWLWWSLITLSLFFLLTWQVWRKRSPSKASSYS